VGGLTAIRPLSSASGYVTAGAHRSRIDKPFILFIRAPAPGGYFRPLRLITWLAGGALGVGTEFHCEYCTAP
jgi:hypothetical protein